MTLAMNRTVISGTPRTISMKTVQSRRMTGMVERRPSASSDAERQRYGDADERQDQRDHQSAPECGFHIGEDQTTPPSRMKNDTTGKDAKQQDGVQSLIRDFRDQDRDEQRHEQDAAQACGRQRSSIG